jgi:hypothetical protein
VQKGFDRKQSTISIFRGRTYSHMLEIRQNTWRQQLLNMVGGFTPVPGTGLTLLVRTPGRQGAERAGRLRVQGAAGPLVPRELDAALRNVQGLLGLFVEETVQMPRLDQVHQRVGAEIRVMSSQILLEVIEEELLVRAGAISLRFQAFVVAA